MKILLLTYFFHPQASPRAFRAYELAKELARRGHAVTVYVPDTGDGTDFSGMGFVVRRVAPGFLFNRPSRAAGIRSGAAAAIEPSTTGAASTPVPVLSRAAVPAGSRWRDVRRAILELVYLGGFTFEYAFTLARALKRHEPDPHDLVISIGLPFGVHLGTALYRGARRRHGVYVADYGDPFSQNPEGRGYPHYRWIERWTLGRFDRVAVPLAAARSAYDGLVAPERIHVIPQGVDFSIARREPYAPGPTVRLCYAGVFYPEIRNPTRLFEHLAASGRPIEFTLYTDLRNGPSMALVDPWRERLGTRLVVKDLVPRAEAIRLMSTQDFLVNQRNAGGVQAPSKLIDYALAGRPVFSFDQDRLDAARLDRFLDRDFEGAEALDLSAFDIRTVATQFEALAQG